MSGFLKIMPISHQQSFLLARNFYNAAWSTQRNPYLTLPSFTYDGLVKSISAITVSEFKVRPITVRGAFKTIDTANIETLSTSLIDLVVGDAKNTMYYRAERFPATTLPSQLCEYYIKLSDNSEYISEPFLFIGDCSQVVTIAGDFANVSPNNDFNEDFYK